MDADQYSNALAAHDEDDEDDGSHFAHGISAAPHHVHSQSDATSFATHADFGRPELSIDPNLESHPPPEHHQDQQQHRQHPHQDDPQQRAHYGEQHMQRQLYSANQYTLDTASEQPSEGSPSQFPSASPAPNPPKSGPASYTPTDRNLPEKHVTDETLDDAYVAFILYCNPSVPLDCDTAELRKAFRQPPKSDGKTFSTYHLLQLIEKFERKDIKTWTKLAIELGVERTPDSSAQKVQQYAVRLKRWMHAMHVDAFFEYILDKPHGYYQHIPHVDSDANTPATERIRDGVPVEEDLALRALHPETRPKRGRRKTDDRDDNSEKDGPSAKRQHLDTGAPASADDMGHFVYPNSAVPSSAGGDGMTFLEEAVSQDQWTAATQSVLSAGASTPTGGQNYRWRPSFPKLDSATTPHSPHPPPLITTHDNHATNDDAMTPISATPTSSKPPRRRRHGPAVSSAWPSSGNPLTGKLRGRPPSNRSVRDGPFSTFPANPSAKGGATIDMSPITATPTPTPVMSHPPFPFPQHYRPPSLHLTVPQQPSRPIPLASPATNGASPHIEWLPPPSQPKADKTPPPQLPPPMPSISLDELQSQLVIAIVQVVGDDGKSVGLNDATAIAERVFSGFRRAYPESCSSDKLAFITGATVTESGFKGLQVCRLQSELEELGIHDPDQDDDYDAADGARGDRAERRYRIRWETMFGDLKGAFEEIVVLSPKRGGEDREFESLTDFGRADDKPADGVEELRKKVLELEGLLKGKEKELGRFRESVLRAVVS